MTKKEKEYLIKLRDFFKKLPDKAINQGLGMLDMDRGDGIGKTCGCFGAWIAKLEGLQTEGFPLEEYHYQDGMECFRKVISSETEEKLEKIAGVQSELFDEYEWDVRPDEAINKLLEQEGV